MSCPQCGAPASRRLSAGAGFQFKGSGFYLTDYGRNAHRAAAAKPDSTADAGAGKLEKNADARLDKAADAKPDRAADAKPEKAPDAKPEKKREARPEPARADAPKAKAEPPSSGKPGTE